MSSPSLPTFRLKEKTLLPIVQGGMGVGISAHRLAGAVAGCGAVGTIAGIDLRRHHADLMAETERCRDRAKIEAANLVALDREIKAAKKVAKGCGMIAVNVMRAVSQYADCVRQACASGADAIVMGAGLPLDLPELAAPWPEVALIPILSDSRGVAVVLKKWQRKGRLPDAIIIEHPGYAGGHLGAAKVDELYAPRFDFQTVLVEVFEIFLELGIDRERIPVILAGGIHTHAQVRALLALGASAVQIGTPFAVTTEGDAHPNFKKVLAEAKPQDIVTFMSVAGLPARAVLTPWLQKYLQREPRLRALARPDRGRCTLAWDCLSHCGLRDGDPKSGQFCIDQQLAAALRGDVAKGLFFRGSESLPFGEAIRSVAELLDYFLTGLRPEMA